MPNQVRVGVGVTGAKGAASELDRFRDRFTKLQQTSAKGFAIGAGAAATTAAFSLVDRALASTIGYLGDSAQAFRDDQVSAQRLTTALRANVEGWDGNTKAIEGQLQARLKLGFSDDEQRESLSGLVAAYGNVTKAIDVQRTAMDLARFSGVDLATATDTLVKVHAGNFRALKALGINTKGITTEQQALAAVMKVVAGQAEDYADTLEGQLVVAEVKAEEASEKFGKSVARLQSVVLPLAADAIDDLANSFDRIQTMADDTAPPIDRMDAALDTISDSVLGQIPIIGDWIAQQKDLLHPLTDAAQASFRLAEKTEILGEAAGDAEQPVDDLENELKETAKAADDANRAIDGLTDSLTDGLFGDAINAGNLAELKEHRAELVKQRGEVEKGSRKYIELTGEIAETDKALFELQLQMKEKEGPAAVIKWLQQQKEKFGDTAGVIQALITKYRTLLGLQSRLAGAPLAGGIAFTGIPTTHRASGGPLAAGQASVVGEKGPEVFVPDSAGTVIPNGATGAAMGSSVVHIHVSTPALTPGGAESLARYLEPIITRAQQRRGVVPRVA